MIVGYFENFNLHLVFQLMIHYLFQHFNDPLEDFTAVPPGILALKVMTYFAEKHTEDYAKVGLFLDSR